MPQKSHQELDEECQVCFRRHPSAQPWLLHNPGWISCSLPCLGNHGSLDDSPGAQADEDSEVQVHHDGQCQRCCRSSLDSISPLRSHQVWQIASHRFTPPFSLLDCDASRHLAAFMILLSWTKFLLLLQKHPAFARFETYIPMFTKASFCF